MEQNLEEGQTAAQPAEEAKAPVRRRASRRVSAAAGAATSVSATVAADAAAEATAPAAEPAVAVVSDEAPAAPKRASRARKKVEPEAEAAPAEVAEADAPAAAAKKAPARTKASTKAAAKTEADTEATAEVPEKEAPKKRATRARKAAAAPEPEATAEAGADAAAADVAAAEAPAKEEAAAPVKTPRTRASRATKAAEAKAAAAQEAAATEAEASGESSADSSADSSAATPANEVPTTDVSTPASRADAQGAGQQGEQSEDAEPTSGRRSRRRSGNQAAGQQGDNDSSANDEPKSRGRQNNGNRADVKADTTKTEAAKAEGAKEDSDKVQERPERSERQDQNSRSSRTRQRDRKRRGGDDFELEVAEDDVLLPIAGILDVLDNYAFVRTSGYLPGVSDVYVALGQVKKYSLRRGDAIVGAIRQPRENDNSGRQKYNAIVKIESVNGKPVEEAEKRPEITEMTPVFPQQQIRLASPVGRVIEAIAPVGLGQRGLIVLPQQFSGAELVRELAADISATSPETHLMVVLTDAQPEVVTELSRTIPGEVVAATFDRLPEDQTTISELGIDRARRLVELGHDVVVLVDSLNRLARGYAQSQQQSARPALGKVDEHAIFQVKRMLAAARNVENGGSLTVLATIDAEGNESDALLLREAKSVVNSVIEFSAESTFDAPALNARESRTQYLQAMLSDAELKAVAANRAKLLSGKAAK